MKSLGLIAQIATVGLSIAIVIMYTVPKYDEIGETQTQVSQYKEQRTKIESTNTQLAQYVATVSSISAADQDRLDTYMPSSVDEAHVMRDITAIANLSGVVFREISFDGEALDNGAQEQSSVTDPTAYSFLLTAEGSYAQIKNLFALLENNEYPLEVHEAEITPLEGGFLSASLVIATYANEEILADEE